MSWPLHFFGALFSRFRRVRSLEFFIPRTFRLFDAECCGSLLTFSNCLRKSCDNRFIWNHKAEAFLVQHVHFLNWQHSETLLGVCIEEGFEEESHAAGCGAEGKRHR